MSYKIPMGPYHPALEEPYKLDMICEGETVIDAKLHIGFNFRGIEHLAETRNYIQVIALMERVCGICSNIHTLTLCQAMEELDRPDAAAARAIYSRHHGGTGAAALPCALGRHRGQAHGLQDHVHDLLRDPRKGHGYPSAICGNRVNYSMNRIGGVNRDIDDPQAILKWSRQLEREMAHTVIPIFTTSTTARSRCAGIGVLTQEKALSCGVVGPVARASGVPQDLRRAAPYAAYAEIEFDVPVSRLATCGSPAGARAGDHGELQDSSPGTRQAASWRIPHRRARKSFLPPERPRAASRRRAEK